LGRQFWLWVRQWIQPVACSIFQLNLMRFSEAINLTATFVHNEPTSLAVIQEMKLHESLYDAMEFNAKPSFDVSSAVTNDLIVPFLSGYQFLLR
jgi:hypothetical protein